MLNSGNHFYSNEETAHPAQISGGNNSSHDDSQLSLFNTSHDSSANGHVEFHIDASSHTGQASSDDNTASNSHSSDHNEETNVNRGTKLKVMAALAIVGIASYVAYWVQEPIQLKTDILSSSNSQVVAQSNSDKNNTADSVVSHKVDISLYGFEPSNLTIKKGEEIVWTNTSSEVQTLMGTALSSGAENFNSPALNSGATFAHTFNEDSTFEYYSTYNPALKAKIVVGTGGTIAGATTTSDTATLDLDSIVANSADNSATTTTLNNSASAASTATSTANSSSATSTVVESDSLKQSAPESTQSTEATTTTVAGTSTTTSTGKVESTTEVSLKDNLKPAALDASEEAQLASSGPEDFLYLGLFFGILLLNRKKFFQFNN